MMRERLLALAEQRARLVARAQAERVTLNALLAPADAAASLAASVVRVARGLLDQAARYPLGVVAGMALLVALRPKRAITWLSRGLVAVAPVPRCARLVAAPCTCGHAESSVVRGIAPIKRAFELAERERKFLLSEMSQVSGLLPILMRRRNKQQWTPEELAQIRDHLKRISKLSPYLVIIVMPGGFAVLPVLAWWLDRRRNRNRDGAAPKSI
ncbi:MAG: hypothetical protein EXR33_10355 [Betaproteobacteria bacterium]|nr:hypothetical protein [Betaproteobacteria bacterium]